MSDYLPFALAFMATAFAPGLESGMVIGVALSDRRGGVGPLALGLLVGKLALLAVAIAGATALAAALGPWFGLVRYLGAAWLTWLAIRRIRHGAQLTRRSARGPSNQRPPERVPQGRWGLFGLGAALTLANPLALSFYFAILPGVVPTDDPWRATPVLAILVVVIMGAAIALYSLIGAALASVLRRHEGAIDIAAGVFMAVAAVLVLVA